MKKIMAIMLSIIMLLSVVSFAACGEDSADTPIGESTDTPSTDTPTETPAEETEKVTLKFIYDKMLENTNALDAYEAKIDVTMNMTVEELGESINTTMSYNIKGKDVLSDSPTVYAEMEMELLDEKVNIVSYVEGDYVYVDAMGSKVKIPKDSEYAEDFDVSGVLSEYNIDLPDDVLSFNEYTTDEDGNYIVSFTFNNDHFDVVEDLVDGILAEMDESFNDIDFSVSEVKYAFVVDKDYMPKGMNMDMTMTATAEGTSMNVYGSYDVEYVVFGDEVTITPPEGYKDYEEFVA